MDRAINMQVIALLVLAALVGFAAALFWLWRRRALSRSDDGRSEFRPRIGFSHHDGMVSIALLLSNQSHEYIWADEIVIFLSDLEAEDQVARPSLRAAQIIRQMIRPNELIPISLPGTIYKAAGEPQREYSCVLSAMLRYRIEKEEFETVLKNCRIRMIGLTASSLHRERRHVPRTPAREKPQKVHAVKAGSK